MGDFRLERLEKVRTGGTLHQMELAIPLPKSDSGKIHRECPTAGCVPGLFQLGGGPDGRLIDEANSPLVRRQPSTSGTTCPYCGTDAPDQDFTFKGDREAARE